MLLRANVRYLAWCSENIPRDVQRMAESGYEQGKIKARRGNVGALLQLPSTEEPKVCVVVLNRNGLSDTVSCVRSLRNVSYGNYEVTIVDNGSEGDDVQVLQREFKGLARIIRNSRNYGFAAGMNIGIQDALHRGAKYVLLMHNDAVVAPSFLTELVKVAEQDHLIGIAGPRIYDHWASDTDSRVRSAGKINWWLGEAFVLGSNFSAQKFAEVDFVSELGLLVKSQVLDKVGLLDSTFFIHRLDYDLCTKARKQGFKVVFVPSSKMWHKYATTRIKMVNDRSMPMRTLLLSSVNHFRFLWRHSFPIQYPFQVAAFFIFVLPRFVLTGMRQPRERIYLSNIIKMLVVRGLSPVRKL